MSKANPEWYELPKERWQEVDENGYRIYRDSYQTKLYRAENMFRHRFWKDKGGEPKFNSIKEVQKYVNKIINSAWVTRRWGKQKPVTVVEVFGHTCSAWSLKRRLSMAKWGWNPVVVLHELAHIFHDFDHGTSHGRYFARILLELITWQFGDDARKELKECYAVKNIKTNPKPQYSKETLQKLRERGKKLAAKYLVAV